jgi:hypothetical protein
VADPIVVLVFLASSGLPDPTDPAMTLSARQALGRDTVVLVDQRPALPGSDEAESLGERQHAAAVVEVEWTDAAHTHVMVRAHAGHRPGWAVREITFLPADPPEQRGRTIGFAMASLIESGGEPSPDASLQHQAEKPERTADEPRFSRVMIDATALGTLGGGPGTAAAGGELAGLVLVHPRVATVVTAGVRFGDLDGSRLSSIQLGGGAVWRAFVFPTPRPFEVDLRADLLATCLLAEREAQTRSAWQPGARISMETVWFALNLRVGFVALAGGEAEFGTASIVAGARTLATSPPLRAVGELGLRARF